VLVKIPDLKLPWRLSIQTATVSPEVAIFTLGETALHLVSLKEDSALQILGLALEAF